MNERKPRRPSDGIKRALEAVRRRRRVVAHADDAPRRSSQAHGRIPEAPMRGDGSAKRTGGPRAARGGGPARKREPEVDGRTGAREPRRTPAEKRTTRDAPAASAPGQRGAPGKGAAGARRSADTSQAAPRKRTARGAAPSPRTGRSGAGKRTSRNSDERNPDEERRRLPVPKYRRKNETGEPAAAAGRSSLRKVRRPAAEAAARPGRSRNARTSTQRPRRTRTGAARPARPRPAKSSRRLAGRNARQAQAELARAAEAFSAGRERDAARSAAAAARSPIPTRARCGSCSV